MSRAGACPGAAAPPRDAGGRAAPPLAHGMGTEPAAPDWPPLAGREVARILARYPPAGGPGGGRVAVRWRSPRPFSAAALVSRGSERLLVKRHDLRVRDGARLAAEHAFAAHLRARGVPAPVVRRTEGGRTTVVDGGSVYEVHDMLPGLDLYRDALSWTPYASRGHARAAGAALAALHLAAADFPGPAWPPGVLISSCQVAAAADPLAEAAALAGARPGLARYLRARRWRADLAEHVLPAIEAAAAGLAALPRQWGHGDWHPSNLTWTASGPGAQVAGVFDFGLANATSAVHDLAVALERAVVGWLDLAGSGRARVDLAGAEALLAGYESVRPLPEAEAAALPAVLPVCHVEYALSEVEYFADVTGSAVNADLAYDGYLLGHARWFAGPDGAALIGWLRRRAG